MTTLRAVLLVMLPLLAAQIVWAQTTDTVSLQPRFVAGQTSRYSLWTRRAQVNEVSVAGNNRKVEVTVLVEGEATWRVERVAGDGSASCTFSFDWLTAELSSSAGGAPRRNDSRQASGAIPSMHATLRAMAGVPLTFDVAADGSIRSVRGADAIRRRVPKDASTPDDSDFLETASDLATLVAAPDSIKVGGTWSAPQQWNHELGKLRVPMRYRLDSIAQIEGVPIATVSGTADLRLDVDRSKLPAQGPKLDVRLMRGSAATQVFFDLDRNQAVGRNTTQTTQLRATFSVQNRNIVSTTDQTIQSQVLRIAE